MQSDVREQDAIERGIEIGIEQKAVEVAKSLLQSGMPIQDVSRHSNLAIEFLEHLI